MTIDQQWHNIQQVLKDLTNAELNSIKAKNKEWITPHIFELMMIRV